MTCTECGGPLDPTVTHVAHSPDPWGCLVDGCGCPEVCADCCTDPDCALREPQETPMTETSEETMATALRQFGWTCGPEFWERYYQDAWVFNLANAVERLVAEVEQVRKERDAAYAVIRKTSESLTFGGLLIALSDVLEPAEVDAVHRAETTETNHD